MDRKTINSLMVNTGGEYSYDYISVEELQKRINRTNGATVFYTLIKSNRKSSVNLWEVVRIAMQNRFDIEKVILVHTYKRATNTHLITIREEDSHKFAKVYGEKFYNYYNEE